MATKRMLHMSLVTKREFRTLPTLLRLLCIGLIMETDNTGKGCVHHAAPGGIVASWRSSCRRSLRRMLPHLAAVSKVIELHHWSRHGQLFWCLPKFHKFQQLKYIGESRHPCCPECGCRCWRQCNAASSSTRFSKRDKERVDAGVAGKAKRPAGVGHEPSRGPIADTVDRVVRGIPRKSRE